MNKLLKAALVCAAATGVAAEPASAKWPNDKPIVIVTPQQAGTAIDILTRTIADGLSKKWNATVLVENRAGASGNIGTDYVAKSNPDGYIFIVNTPGAAANNSLTYKSLPYDPLRDFVGVTQTTEDVMVMIMGPRTPQIKSLKEFIAYAKANPGKVQMGHPGLGTYAHMILLAMQDQIGTEFNLVPYKGAPQMTADMLSGQIDGAVNFPGGHSAAVQAGQLSIAAVISDARSDMFKEAPTLKEFGIDFSATPWTVMQAPKGTPREIIVEVNKAVLEILNDPEVRKKLLASNINTKTSTPEGADKLVQSEVAKWRPVITKYKISSD